jgi:hypothetical protein
MCADKTDDPFHPYVQELQAQEKDIAKKIEIIEDILDKLDFDDPDQEAALREKLEAGREALDKARITVAGQKLEDLEKELEILIGLARNPGRFNPQPPPPWVWPWPWPPPPGFPGPGSPAPGMISAGIVTKPSENRFEVGLASREYIVTRSATKVWVWNPHSLAWEAELDLGAEIVELEKVDGTIAVRSKSALWLFHPIDYRWLGPLNAEIVEIKAFDLATPTLVEKK